MATRKTRTLGIKAKVWGTTSMMEFDGDLASGLKYSFFYLGPVARAELLEQLAEGHKTMLAAEAKASGDAS